MEVARRAGEPSIAVEALLALGDLELEHRNFPAAQDSYQEALASLPDERDELRARVEERLARLAEARANADRAA
ncbi:MAG: hypothetical protein A3J75_04430 [Acidobacteria bacterium RBG_16_68_9]|nr:MAG: hypothetical protein A3J75_04430 [Acidobacteria bacterium RBG_16_68_9]